MSRISTNVKWSMVPEWISDHEQAGLSHAAVRLYAILWRFANSEGEGAIPSRGLLAKRMGLKALDQVDKAKRELVAAGALEVVNRRSNGRQTTNEYKLSQAPPPGRGKQGREKPTLEKPTRENPTHNESQGLNERSVPSGTDAPTLPGMDVPVVEKPKRERPPDLLWEAMVEALGKPPLTESAKGAWRKAIKELRDAGATPDEIRAAAVAYRREWPDITITPTALAKHWHVFVGVAENDTPIGKAQRWVRTAGRELPDAIFEDHLETRKGLTDEQRAELRALRATLIAEDAATEKLAAATVGDGDYDAHAYSNGAFDGPVGGTA
jgi:DNA-binding transcriptional MerR regulator